MGNQIWGNVLLIACDLFVFKNQTVKPVFPFCAGKGLKWLVLWMFSAWGLVLLFVLIPSNKSLEYVVK